MVASKVSLKLLVDTKQEKVIFAEANKDFIDLLFSLLTLPIATTIKLLEKKNMVGCLAKLFESVENLEDNFMQSNMIKDVLLKPEIANLESLLLTDEVPTGKKTRKLYYVCSGSRSSNLSPVFSVPSSIYVRGSSSGTSNSSSSFSSGSPSSCPSFSSSRNPSSIPSFSSPSSSPIISPPSSTFSFCSTSSTTATSTPAFSFPSSSPCHGSSSTSSISPPAIAISFASSSTSCSNSSDINTSLHLYVADNPLAICPQCKRRMSTAVQFVSSEGGVKREEASVDERGYVKGMVTYMVTDDLVVEPSSSISTINRLNKLHVTDIGVLVSKVVTFGESEGLKLLEASLKSESVLTSVFLGNKQEYSSPMRKAVVMRKGRKFGASVRR